MNPVSLRTRFFIYLAVVHTLFAAVAYLVVRTSIAWLVAVEGVFLLSLVIGIVLMRALFEPLALIRSGAAFIRENDFATRFTETGPPEMTDLIRVYNRMVDNLREERIRNREQEHFLRDVLAASPSGVVTLDLDGRIATVNPGAEALLARKAENLVGRKLDEAGSAFAEQLLRLAPGETRVIRLQGRRRVKCQKLTFMDRGFHRPFLLLDELTEELHRSEKAAYGKLIRMMSHEVNNTAGAVNSLLQSCQTYRGQLRMEDSADFDRALNVAISRNSRMNEFMQGFADVIRLPAPRRVPCDVVALFENVAHLMSEERERRHIEWQWETEADLVPIPMDPAQMEQAFINIIKNGIEAIEARAGVGKSSDAGTEPVAAGPGGSIGTLTIRIARIRGRASVAVRDTGPGIPAEVQENLFTPFFTTKADGQGIGLTMVQEILLAHGFDFSLQEIDGGGAEFVILF